VPRLKQSLYRVALEMSTPGLRGREFKRQTFYSYRRHLILREELVEAGRAREKVREGFDKGGIRIESQPFPL
jgi:hypothetical protein